MGYKKIFFQICCMFLNPFIIFIIRNISRGRFILSAQCVTVIEFSRAILNLLTFYCTLASEIESATPLYYFNAIPSCVAKVSR